MKGHLLVAGLLIVGLALPLGLPLGWKLLRVADAGLRVDRAADELLALRGPLQADPLKSGTLDAVERHLVEAGSALLALRTELYPFAGLLMLTRPLPPHLSWLADVPDTLDLAAPLAQIGATGLQGVRPLVAALADEEANRIEALAAAAEQLTPRVPELQLQTNDALRALARMRGRSFHGPLQPLNTILPALDDAMTELQVALAVTPSIGPAVGMDRPRSYLLLGQNNRELRATGGFIGSAGVITIDRGGIVQFDYGSSYLVDEAVLAPPPPAPLARYLGLGGWYLRDANWWPDFPSTAVQIEQAWRRAGNGQVDGVIAIDNETIRELLRAVGPLQVPGVGMVRAETFEQQAAEHLYSLETIGRAGGFHQAKAAFLAPVGAALVERLLHASLGDLLPLRTSLGRLLNEKHIQIAVKDPDLSRVFHGQNWAGAMRKVPGDGLRLLDTTVSYGDTYPYVRSDLRIEGRMLESGTVMHQITLNYANVYPSGLEPWMTSEMVEGSTFDPATGRLVTIPGFWGNWLRVYLPEGASAVQISGLQEVAPTRSEFGRTLVAGYLPLEPGASRTVTVQYDIQVPVPTPTYRFSIEKQAGTQCRPTVAAFRWPSGRVISYEECPRTDVEIPFRELTER